MIRNGKDIPNGTVINTDVCVVGSGPAGITLAWFLQKSGIKVTLIEGSRDFRSGDFKDSWPDKTCLYNGEAVGQFTSNEPNFLIRPYYSYDATCPPSEPPKQPSSSSPWERERVYGGTSTHWGGQSRKIGEVTFQGNANYSGWPISRSDLDPYYKIAADFCKLHGDDFSADYWAGVLGTTAPKLQDFDTDMYQFIGSNYLNFATRTFDGCTIGDSSADVILNASLLNVKHKNGTASALTVASMNDEKSPSKLTEFTIVAKKYVLAMGAVANARQMLLSEIPNDNIGRYFMAHPVIANYMDGLGNPITINGSYLTQSEIYQMDGKKSDGTKWEDSNGVSVQGRFSPSAATRQAHNIGSCWFWAGGGGFYFEQAPNPNSRVTLSDTTDSVFDQKQTKIHWAFSDADEHTYNTLVSLFQDAVKAKNENANVIANSWEQIKSRAVVNGHHMGTTRMSGTAADGVVDANLKSHDIDNLYVAGSSVWASAGIPNPTFSIITFSIRLADHLIQQLNNGLTQTWTIHGKAAGGGAGLKVEAWDKDKIGKDDYLGSAITDELGNFSISWDGQSHKELIFDKNPDVYFKIFDQDGNLLRQSEAYSNVNTATPFFKV